MTEVPTKLGQKLNGKKILIIGASVTGRALLTTLSKFLTQPDISITDDNSNKLSDLEFLKIKGDATVIDSLANWPLLIKEFNLIIPSPGVPKSHPILTAALDAKTEILSEIEIGYMATDLPIIAITGTNGKTTVTTLVNEVLTSAGIESAACGNIGTSLIEIATEADKYEYLVTEVSSFQLEFTKTFKPKVGAWLNLSEDHLDWHENMADYARAKAKIWQNQQDTDIGIYNTEDPVIASLFQDTVNTKISKNGNNPPAVTFGYTTGNFHCQDDFLVYQSQIDIKEVVRLISLNELKRKSKADILNFLAVYAICSAVEIKTEIISEVVKKFTGLEHRVEYFLTKDQITWINDSKATTPASVVAALESLDNVVLILGGKDKGLDFRVLNSNIERIKAFVFIGDLAQKLVDTFEPYKLPYKIARSMEEAVEDAFSFAKEGTTILLSPGGTSYDWYKDYKQRGNDFKDKVKNFVLENSNE